MQNKTVEWIILSTENFEESRNFYKNILGLEVIRETPEEEFVQFGVVSLVALFLNSGFVAVMTKYIAPPFGLNATLWVNAVKAMG
ncbi:hypothetical protein HY310_03500, partial [Candidatus Microgenomates bacterium]|nr:hypothetical protein [Candidatus Microgenomates bacterium]